MSNVTGRESRVGSPDGSTRHVDTWLRDELDTAYETCMWGEGPVGLTVDIDGFTIDEVAGVLHQAQARSAAARHVVRCLKTELAGRLVDGEAYRHEDTIYRRGLKVTRRLIDPEAFVDWCADDLVAVVRIDPSAVRTTAVRAVCARRGVDVSTVWDTFFDFEESGEELKQMPLGKAPVWTQRLGEGERGTR